MMQPQDPQELDFTLEDIIREFSDPVLDEIMDEFGTDLEPEQEEDPPQELEAEPEPEPVPPPSPTPTPVTSDTVRLDPVTPQPPQPVSQDTAVFMPSSMPELIPDDEPEPEPEPVPSPVQREPFSDDWEPEYDEPMGEYPQPISFPSRDRQAMLRKKLVAGPEKRYHTLASHGLGKLQAGIVLHLILLLLSGAGTVLFTFGSLPENQLRLLIFAQLVVAMIAGLLGCYRMLVGVGSLLRGRFSLNTLLFITFVVCMVDGYFCLSAQRMPHTTLLCLELLMAQWAEYQRRSTQMGQMDTLRKALEVTAIVKVPNYYEGQSGYVAAEGDPDSFMAEYYKPSAPEKRLDLFGLLALLSMTALAVYIGMNQGLELAMQILSAGLLAAVPATSLVIISRPTAILEHRLHRLGTVLCGWKGVREADRRAVFPLTHADLFPMDCTKMNGVKFYGPMDPGRVVAYSTALIAHDGEGMMSVFAHLPRSRHIHQHQVTEFLAYPSGISGLVDGWAVLVGTQDFMTEMGISIPDEAKIPQAVYASVDGQFSAVFALQYSRSKSSAAGIRTLSGYRQVKPVLTACDFILTDQFIQRKLSVSVRRIIFPEREVRQHLASTPVPEDAPVVALVTRTGLAAKAYAITGARALRATLNIGSAVHIIAGGLGLAAVAVLALTGAFDVLNTTNLLCYSLVWMVPGLMITEWTRYI